MNLQVLFLLAAMLATESVAERQTFDTALAATNGGWVSGNLPYNNSDFGFKNSGNAGGPAGEMGGAIYREAKVSYYADTTINSNLNANAALSATGTFYGVNNDYNGDFCIGWFNKSAGGGTSLPRFVGLQFSEGSDFRFRAASGLSGALSNSATGTILENTVYGWQILYDPNGGVTGRVSVTVSGTTRTYDLTTFERNAVATFDAFGLFTLPLSDSASDCRAYFDSLEYTTGASASSVIRNVGPSDITQTSASLNGELMSTGAPTWTVYVAWGGTDVGTNMTWANWQNLGAPGTGTLVYVANTLTPDTAYYYTFLASNANEMAWAVPSARFTTALGTGAVPGNLAASALNGCQVRLTWIDNSATETGFIVEKSTNGVFWTAGAVSGANATNITVSGLNGVVDS